MKTTNYKVLDMTCGGCKNKIETALSKVTGVQQAEGNVSDKSLVVTYDESVTNNQAIIDAVKEVGYTATTN